MITFDSLPSAVAALQSDMEMIKRLLQQLPNSSSVPQDEILTIDECAAFLHIKKATVYTMVSERRIPFMKQGKMLKFSKNDLTTWLKESCRKVRKEELV